MQGQGTCQGLEGHHEATVTWEQDQGRLFVEQNTINNLIWTVGQNMLTKHA